MKDMTKYYVIPKTLLEVKLVIAMLQNHPDCNDSDNRWPHKSLEPAIGDNLGLVEGHTFHNLLDVANRTELTISELNEWAYAEFGDPWDDIPAGWRLVTNEERNTFKKPHENDVAMKALSVKQCDKKFETNAYLWCWTGSNVLIGGNDAVYYIIPEDYVFKKPVKEISSSDAIAELSRKYGCEVKLVK